MLQDIQTNIETNKKLDAIETQLKTINKTCLMGFGLWDFLRLYILG